MSDKRIQKWVLKAPVIGSEIDFSESWIVVIASNRAADLYCLIFEASCCETWDWQFGQEFADFKCQICQKLNRSRFGRNSESGFMPSNSFCACNFIVPSSYLMLINSFFGLSTFFLQFVSRKLLFFVSNNKSDKLVIQFSRVVVLFALYRSEHFCRKFSVSIQKWLQIAHNVYYYILSAISYVSVF